jgi:hypothetical protein
MNTIIADSLFGYFKTLYEINQQIILLCGHEANKFHDTDTLMIDIIQKIPRILPFSYDRNTGLFIENSDGLMEFRNEITYLSQDYGNIIKRHEEILLCIRKIRNKYEHSMHRNKFVSSGSGTSFLLDMVFKVNGDEITIDTNQLINLVKDLNNLFDKIANELKKLIIEKHLEDSGYSRRLFRFMYSDFNEIYNLHLDYLKAIGRISKDF